jgi:hypothetical protein
MTYSTILLCFLLREGAGMGIVRERGAVRKRRRERDREIRRK